MTAITAKWIEPEGEIDIGKRQPAGILRKKFSYQKSSGTVRLVITAHGCYEAYLNGKRVGDFVFAPGTGDYDRYLPMQSYDVTEMLRDGENELRVLLGDGWYRSASGVQGERNLFGTHVGLLAWLERGGEILVQTDDTWEAAASRALLSSDMCQGEVYDASAEGEPAYGPVHGKGYPTDNLSFDEWLPIREKERFEGKLIRTPDGRTVIDFGQNLAGYVEMEFEAHAGQRLTLTHGETLDEEGNFTIANFQPGDRHKEGGIFQKITYIAKEGVNTYKPHFCIFGFRYALAETDIDLSNARFTAIAVYSDMRETARFRCSNPLVEQLFHNAVWSMKGNFCDVPTDCPTRERAGWTGDAGIFVHTGTYLMDCDKVFRKWLVACRNNQYPNGMVRNIAPKNNAESRFSKMLAGSAGWGDAAVIVPYELYQKSGDLSVLADNYEMGARWIVYLRSRAKSGIKKLFSGNPYKKYLVSSGIDYGEWCEPDVGMKNGVDVGGKSGVATAYLAYSSGLMAEIADALGKAEDARQYRELSENAKKAYRCAYTDNGRIVSDRQKDYVRAIALDLLPEEEKKAAAADLNQLVIRNGYHLNTGFLSTPHLCGALSDYGYTETAYRLLLQEEQPGWLYQVKQGATTTWETWDGKASQNHYSYGSVCGWLIERMCGIRYTHGKIVLAPQPCSLLEYAEASYDSSRGTISAGWHYQNGKCTFTAELPEGVTATLRYTDGTEREVVGKVSTNL